jgi:hypothetical protein
MSPSDADELQPREKFALHRVLEGKLAMHVGDPWLVCGSRGAAYRAEEAELSTESRQSDPAQLFADIGDGHEV